VVGQHFAVRVAHLHEPVPGVEAVVRRVDLGRVGTVALGRFPYPTRIEMLKSDVINSSLAL
jgi:hypothetical protein